MSHETKEPFQLGEYQNERNMEEFWAEIRPRKEPARKPWFIPTVLLLLLISIPWYFPEGYVGQMVGGLPIWIWVALVCSAGVSLVTAYAAWKHWDDDEFKTGQKPITRKEHRNG